MAETSVSRSVFITSETNFCLWASLNAARSPVVFDDSIRVTAINFVSGETRSGCCRGFRMTSSAFKTRVCARKATAKRFESNPRKSSGRSQAHSTIGGKWDSFRRLRVCIFDLQPASIADNKTVATTNFALSFINEHGNGGRDDAPGTEAKQSVTSP